MNDRGWLWTLGIVVLALFAYDWLRGRGRGAGRRPIGERWDNLQTPKDEPVSTGLAPNASGQVPDVDINGGERCSCS